MKRTNHTWTNEDKGRLQNLIVQIFLWLTLKKHLLIFIHNHTVCCFSRNLSMAKYTYT